MRVDSKSILTFLVLLLGASSAHAAAPARTNELGWLCFAVSDLDIEQISAFNRESPTLSIWVSKARLYTEPATDGGRGGRVCAPTVVALGEDDLPAETLVFERLLGTAPDAPRSHAEVVITPTDPALAEVTVEVESLPDSWRQRDGVWTYSHPNPIAFPERAVRSLVGEADGLPPDQAFPALAKTQTFQETCQPIELGEAAAASFGDWDARAGKVVARGIEPLTLAAGTRVSRCEGAALDTMMMAVAKPGDDTKEADKSNTVWYLVARDTTFKVPAGQENVRYLVSNPIGGYHVCRQPTWTTAILEDVPLSNYWELVPGQGWQERTEFDRDKIKGGTHVELLDQREGWAVIQGDLPVSGGGSKPRILAIKASAVALPSGGGNGVLQLGGGLCSTARGQWRASKSNTQAFKVSQETPGAELAGLWLELPMGTQVLQLCQDGSSPDGRSNTRDPACSPIYVGGAQGKEGDRFVLVRYAASYLAIREDDLRDRMTGEFALREQRPWPWRKKGTIVEDEPSGWVLGIGPGARIGFADKDDHAWVIRARMQRLTDEKLGFEGGFGVGGDGLGTFIELTAGLGKKLYQFPDVPIELRVGAGAKLDFYTSGDQGLGFDVIGKLQLRWVNDVAPVNLELGLNLGYGGTFGAAGEGHFRFGMPFMAIIELARF